MLKRPGVKKISFSRVGSGIKRPFDKSLRFVSEYRHLLNISLKLINLCQSLNYLCWLWKYWQDWRYWKIKLSGNFFTLIMINYVWFSQWIWKGHSNKGIFGTEFSIARSVRTTEQISTRLLKGIDVLFHSSFLSSSLSLTI